MTKFPVQPAYFELINARIKEIFIIILLCTIGVQTASSQSDCEQDTIPPFFTYIAGDALEECNLTPPVIAAKAQDNCTELVLIEQEIDTIFGSCPQNYILFITHIATDEQGNSVTAQQVIQIVDSNAPVFLSFPSDTTVLCSSIPDPTGVVAWDNCGEVTLTLSETFTDEPGCTSILTRQWTAVDECGNENSAIQTLTVIDDLPPEIVTMPEDQVAECGEIPEHIIEANDACSTELTYGVSESIEEGDCPNEYTITRDWTVSDDCGNQVSGSYVIAVVDTQGPEFIDMPKEIFIECPDEPMFVNPSLQDCGSDIEISYIDSTFEGECPVLYSVMRTWIATDACGNSSIADQFIHVEDNTPPVFVDPPSSLIVQCESEIPPVPDIEYFDECGEVENVIFKENPLTDFCGEGLRRTWAVFDECGNMGIYTQDIEVNDTTPPMVVSAPADTTISCEDSLPDGMAIFEDNCDNPIDIFLTLDTVGSGCPEAYSIAQTWTAFDMCGNHNSYTQIVYIEDTTPPVFMGDIVNQTISCENDSIPEIPELTAIDNCDSEVEIIFSDTLVPGSCSGSYSIIRIWTATDDCENESSVVQTIDVVDSTPPVLIDFPTDTIYECDNVPGAAAGTALDCSDDITIILSQFGWGGSCEGTFFRQWMVTDGCGNTSTHLQEMTIVDTTPPEFDSPLPTDMNVSCDSIPLPAEITAIDNCGAAAVIFEENAEPEDCENGYAITRTWTALDECGNTVTHTQVLNAQNIQEPDEELTEQVTDELTEAIAPISKIQDGFTENIEDGNELPLVKVDIIPNPTADYAVLTIMASERTATRIEIYQLSGNKVMDIYAGILEQDETYLFDFNGESLAPGIYLYQITSDRKVITDKLILTK